MAGVSPIPEDAVLYENALRVRPEERDRALDINGGSWPTFAPEGWAFDQHALKRVIRAEESPRSPIPVALEELVLRFPSAPVHGMQRLHEHHMELGPSENFHTFRVLRSADPNVVAAPIRRIFLMHTGLNERDRMGLYYRLASQLIAQSPETVCIVRPFPGHMTRYPFQAFAETPLDLYLWDGSHLFRQFLRFMIETQWFLSAIVRRSSYRCASGANLLGESDEIAESRLDAGHLSREIGADWLRLHRASLRTAKSEMIEIAAEEARWEDGRQSRPPVNAEIARRPQIRAAIEALRETLNLDRDFEPRSGDLTEVKGPEEPALHVLGYSLGGFTAQSVFMSWPFVIASCSTMLAGGALRELAPTGFADPEEWQTVLHSLRYELDDRMMSKHLGPKEADVGGIDRDLFTYFKRTFYEVFQQEYRGSIQSRYEAFGDRMFFIVGGDDPVMRPESVLRSGPKGGLNLLEVGGLGHFLQDSTGEQEAEQHQTFWLPEMSTLIDRFSDNAADQHQRDRERTWFNRNLAHPELKRAEWLAASEGGKSRSEAAERSVVRPLSPAEVIAIESEGALPGALFERCLDDLLSRITGEDRDGVLFILRNEVPTVLLPPQATRETAAALYHDDLSIARYCLGIAARREVLKKNIDRICLVLPWNARSIVSRMDLQRAYPSQAESAGGQVAQRLSTDLLWNKSLDQCFELSRQRKGHDSIRVFNGNHSAQQIAASQHEEDKNRLRALVKRAGEFTRPNGLEAVPSLPDCWIWASSEQLSMGDTSDMWRGIDGLLDLAHDKCASPADIARPIREDQLRVVNVSRARYNPRFRGRLVVDASAARKRVLHAALCVALSEPIADQDRSAVFV